MIQTDIVYFHNEIVSIGPTRPLGRKITHCKVLFYSCWRIYHQALLYRYIRLSCISHVLHRVIGTQLRTSHLLEIETSRYADKVRKEQICQLCRKDVELLELDIYHYIIL